MSEQNQIESRKIQIHDAVRSIPAARPLSDFAVETIGDELVILDGETLQYHTLNQEAADLWVLCDDARTAQDLSDSTGLPVEIVESTVDALGEAGLLQSPASEWDATLSRRRATKLIAAGVIGAIGLPIISSVTAPDASAQNSCRPVGSACTPFQFQCCNICCFGTCRTVAQCFFGQVAPADYTGGDIG